MKSLVPVLLVAVSVAMSGCAPAQLSTADTCKEFNALGAMIGSPADMSADEKKAVPAKFRDLANHGADSLRDDIATTADYLPSAMDGNGASSDLSSKWGAAARRIQAVCNTTH